MQAKKKKKKPIQIKYAHSSRISQSCAVRPELGLAVLSHTLQWSKYSIVGNVVQASCVLLGIYGCKLAVVLTNTDIH